MRENMGLYRGKKVKPSVFDKTDWVYGSLIDSGNHEQVAIYPWYDGASTMSVRQLVYTRMEGVKPETVGLCSGVPDKHGKLIFEGDILEYVNMDGEKAHYVVEWDTSCGAWIAKCIEGDGSLFPCPLRLYMEVIGNIHDNPELLEADHV